MIQSQKLRVRWHFIEPVLGTSSANEELYRGYIASKAPNAETIEDEIEALGIDGVAEKGMTIFAKTDEMDPFLWDYQLKGFFKGAFKCLRAVPGTVSYKLTNYKANVDQHLFIKPRRVVFKDYGNLDILQRPLRAQTAQGERIALAASEKIDAGASIEFVIELLPKDKNGITLEMVREALDYGEYSGEGQWRNAGFGRFLWEELDEDGKVIGGNYNK